MFPILIDLLVEKKCGKYHLCQLVFFIFFFFLNNQTDITRSSCDEYNFRGEEGGVKQ